MQRSGSAVCGLGGKKSIQRCGCSLFLVLKCEFKWRGLCIVPAVSLLVVPVHRWSSTAGTWLCSLAWFSARARDRGLLAVLLLKN